MAVKGNIISSSGGNNQNLKKIRRSQMAERLLYLDGRPFSLKDYPHMRAVYDMSFEQLVLKTSRQVSKCSRKSFILNNLPESAPKMAKDLMPGDELLSYDEGTGKIVRNKIKAIEDNGVHPIYQIKTRTGSVIEVTGNHPIWTYGWTDASELRVGNLVGIARNTEAALPTEKTVQDYEYKIVAYLLAEGGIYDNKTIRFTNSEYDLVEDFTNAVISFNPHMKVTPLGNSKYTYSCTAPRIRNNPLLDWTREIGIQGHNSQTKFHPEFVYKLTKEQLCDYIKVWFDTDGYVSLRPNGVQIEIALISKKLIDGLRDFLSRLGIFSSISEKKVKIYEGTNKKCWCLRVEGRGSKLRFYDLIKTKKLKEVNWPETENNNRLVYPKQAVKSVLDNYRYKNFGANSMYKNGLQASPSYDVSQTKLAKYCEVLEDPELEIMYNGDIIYDRITEINILPPEDTLAIEMEDPHKNYLVDHIVTHNSTTLANLITLYSITYPHFRSMFVAPRQDQTKVFSRDRLGPTMTNSPAIKAHFLDPKMDQNVFYRQFKNGSKCYLRYAYHDADALRGFSTDMNLFDECFTDNMELLTRNGEWVSVDELELTHEFATVDPNGNLEYQLPSRIIEKEFDGNILKFSHRSFNLEVTPKHNLYLSQDLNTGPYRKWNKGWRLEKAEEYKDSNFKFKSAAPYQGKNTDTIVVPEYETLYKPNGDLYQKGPKVYKEETVDTKAFMSFMGWYLSEGHCCHTHRNVILVQNEGEHADEIREVLDATGLIWREYKSAGRATQFFIKSGALWGLLEPLGKSHDKYIPDYCLEQTDHLLDLLISLYKGDAMRHVGEEYGELNTASKRLADTTQLAWMYLGRKATIRQVTEKYNGTVMYRIRPQSLDYQIFWNSANRVSEVPYSGKVYCATVSNGTLIVRDKIEKTPVIVGNCQDLVEDVIPVANQTMTRSEFKKEVYSGTPKRTQGTLSDRWFASTQNEWAIKCEKCSHWNVPLDESNIGDSGVICSKCGKGVNPSNGQWVAVGDPSARMIGFRVCAPMFANAPWVDWRKDIIEYRKNFGEAKFYNEVMGLEYDDGVAPISTVMIKDACQEHQPMTDKHTPGSTYAMGVDYGPINSNNSFTYVTIGKWVSADKFQFTYFKRYYGKEADPAHYHQDVSRLFIQNKAIRIGADFGMGEASNSEIRKSIGYDKLVAYQFSDSVKQLTQYNPKIPGYILNKSKVIDMFIDNLKNGKILLPRYSDFKPHEREFTNLNIEYDERFNKRKYTKIGTDDGLMSAIFCYMAALIVRNAL